MELQLTVTYVLADDPQYSHMLVVWGQYIDHDTDFTPQSLSTSTFQGMTDCKKTCMNLSPCYPIQVRVVSSWRFSFSKKFFGKCFGAKQSLSI